MPLIPKSELLEELPVQVAHAFGLGYYANVGIFANKYSNATCNNTNMQHI